MNNLSPAHQRMLATWQQHTHAEFVLKNADAALATMTDDPYVLCIPTGIGGIGRSAVRRLYANLLLPSVPPDWALDSVSQTFGDDRIVEEFVVRFTHALEMDWILPGVRPTGRKAEFVLVGIIQFRDGKIAHEHIHWDQATLLSQLGVLDHPVAAAGIGSAAQLLQLSSSAAAAERSIAATSGRSPHPSAASSPPTDA